MFLCHFQSSFDVFARCSHFPHHSGIWLRTSLQDGQCYSQCFSVPSSVPYPEHFFSSDQPTSYNLLCSHPPSTTNFLITMQCLSVHDSLVFIHNIAWMDSSHIPSHSCSTSSNGPPSPCFRSIFYTSCGPIPRCATLAIECPDHEFRTWRLLQVLSPVPTLVLRSSRIAP